MVSCGLSVQHIFPVVSRCVCESLQAAAYARPDAAPNGKAAPFRSTSEITGA